MLRLKHGAVGAKDKKKVQQIKKDEDPAGPEAEMFKVDVAVLERAEDGEVENGGHDQRRYGDHQHGAVHGGRAAGKALHRIANAAGDQAESEHKKQVADDAAGKRRFHHVDMAGMQGEEGDDHLRGIAHGGAEDSANRRPGIGCQNSGGFTQDRKSTRLNSSHGYISYAGFFLEKKRAKARGHTKGTRVLRCAAPSYSTAIL